MGLGGLATISVELNSTCYKATHCSFCGHQKPTVNRGRIDGEMTTELVSHLADEIPAGTVVQFHRGGDPLDYTYLGFALRKFAHCIRNLVTHGERLAARRHEWEDQCETICVSMFHGDPDRMLQLENLRTVFQDPPRRPRLLVKWVGAQDNLIAQELHALGIQQLSRLLHVPQGTRRYAKSTPTIPEIGICLDALHHPSIDYLGRMSLCNRMDPDGSLILGDLHLHSIEDCWTGPVRTRMLQSHIDGKRTEANDVCAACEFWGVGSE